VGDKWKSEGPKTVTGLRVSVLGCAFRAQRWRVSREYEQPSEFESSVMDIELSLLVIDCEALRGRGLPFRKNGTTVRTTSAGLYRIGHEYPRADVSGHATSRCAHWRKAAL
jgi:hypothetical protein